MEIEATWGHVIRIWWALLWRTLAVYGAGLGACAVAGGLLGLALGKAGASPEAIRAVAGVIGFGIGVPLGLIPIKLVLGRDFGDFRLVLVEKPGQD